MRACSALLAAALACFGCAPGPRPPERSITAVLQAAEAQIARRDYRAAEASYRHAVEASASEPGPQSILALSGLALLLQSQKRFDEALPFYERAYALAKAAYGRGHPRPLSYLKDIAAIFRAKKDAPREEVLLREILAEARASGRASARLDALEDLAGFLQAHGRDAEALQLLNAAVATLDRGGPEDGRAARLRAAREGLLRRLKIP